MKWAQIRLVIGLFSTQNGSIVSDSGSILGGNSVFCSQFDYEIGHKMDQLLLIIRGKWGWNESVTWQLGRLQVEFACNHGPVWVFTGLFGPGLGETLVVLGPTQERIDCCWATEWSKWRPLHSIGHQSTCFRVVLAGKWPYYNQVWVEQLILL